ncbi:hypothetical protein D3C77_396190 [compost metagenome]
MIKAALRPPTGKGGLHLGSDQAQVAQWRVLEQVVGVGVHVAHQHLMAVTADQLTDVGQLQGAGLGTQGQVHHDYYQRIFAFAKTHQDRTATGRTGQGVIFEQLGLESAEDAVAVLGKAPEVTIELLIPVGEGTQLGQVLYLIHIPGAQAATVGLLQRHQIEVAQQLSDFLQVAGTPIVR